MEVTEIEDMIVDTIEYRGYKVDILCDDYGQCYYCVLDGEEINFGTYNLNYEDDLKYLLDCKLDTISYFEDYPGAKLMWFDNNGHWDIELLYKMKIINVWNIEDRATISEENIEKIIMEANHKLQSIL